MSEFKVGDLVRVAAPTPGAPVAAIGMVCDSGDLPEEVTRSFCALLLDTKSMDLWHDFVPVKFISTGTDGFYHKQTLRKSEPRKSWSIGDLGVS